MHDPVRHNCTGCSGRNTLAMILTTADQCKLRLMGSRAWPTLLSEFAPLDQDMGSLYIMFIKETYAGTYSFKFPSVAALQPVKVLSGEYTTRQRHSG
jgi:hypothetical protein